MSEGLKPVLSCIAAVDENGLLADEHGLVQPRLEGSLGLLLSLERIDDHGMTLQSGRSLGLQLGIQRGDGSFLEIRDDADRLISASCGELSFDGGVESSRTRRGR